VFWLKFEPGTSGKSQQARSFGDRNPVEELSKLIQEHLQQFAVVREFQ
jgi:hypothetical protein